jgi:RNA polymerase sigma-70 factor (ECF subfamily)
MWPEPNETRELLSKARQGDAEAVNRLWERHREALRRMVEMRMDHQLERRVDASDVAQDVLIEANRRLDEYLSNPALPFHVWLRRLAKHRIIDLHRRHRVAAKRSLDREQPLAARVRLDESTMDLANQLADREMTPAEAATWRELERRFQKAVEELDDIDREVILMRHFEQLSNSEVAAALDLSEPAASMRYLRAMRRLRALLGNEEE